MHKLSPFVLWKDINPFMMSSANQWTGFYMITASVMKELNTNQKHLVSIQAINQIFLFLLISQRLVEMYTSQVFFEVQLIFNWKFTVIIEENSLSLGTLWNFKSFWPKVWFLQNKELIYRIMCCISPLLVSDL